MKPLALLPLLLATAVWTGCVSSPRTARDEQKASTSLPADPLQEKAFALEVLRHVYRWHFDQSYVLGAGNLKQLDVWSRRLHPPLDPGDRSEYAEIWIPAVNTVVELKRAQYRIEELNLDINEPTFKVVRVNRQVDAPAARRAYQVGAYSLDEVRDYLFTTRTNRVPISDSLRQAARKLVAEYLNKAYPESFTQNQIGYISPLSPVSNELWFFWETGRKILFFSADVDLANPGFSQLSQLRMQIIDLDKDVVTSTQEVPGSNAFVTKDWVGRLLFNCILYGERVVRTPDQVRRLQSDPTTNPIP